ncbi:hypothetical protein HUJ05_007202 [Dendroctonus ponderosae]|nr:hypothetical protein HUJ05_007202 [Dendroctonus ponderosae]
MNMRSIIAKNGAIYLQLYIVSIIICGFYVFSLALFGERLGNEVRRTVNSCTEMAHFAPRIFTVDSGRDFEEKFLIIAQNLHQRRRRINAAGFFTIDHSMILLVASNVCTYLLVACQLG